jgi:hypothetical protein
MQGVHERAAPKRRAKVIPTLADWKWSAGFLCVPVARMIEMFEGMRFLKYSARVMANLENLLGKNPLPIINENNFQEVCRETERKHWESGESAQDCARSIYPLLMPFALD